MDHVRRNKMSLSKLKLVFGELTSNASFGSGFKVDHMSWKVFLLNSFYNQNSYLFRFLFFFFPFFGFGAGLEDFGGAISSLGTQSLAEPVLVIDFWRFSNSSTGKNLNGVWARIWFWPFEPTGWLIRVTKTILVIFDRKIWTITYD